MMTEQADIKEFLSILARRIRERRTERGLTQEALAERAGISANYLAKLELGWKTPSVDTLVRLARALGVQVCDLAAVEQEEPWLDKAREITYALSRMPASDADFAFRQFRAIVDYLSPKA